MPIEHPKDASFSAISTTVPKYRDNNSKRLLVIHNGRNGRHKYGIVSLGVMM